MIHRFQRRQIAILCCSEQHRHHPKGCLATSKPCDTTVIELIGTGLAIEQIHDAFALGRFKLVHIASGTVISTRSVSTVVEAGRWIRAIAPLCDWTQPLDTFRPPQGLAEQVELARIAALCETHNCHEWQRARKQGYRLRQQIDC